MKKLYHTVFKYLCWGCGLWIGYEDEDISPSDLCPSCKKQKQ